MNLKRKRKIKGQDHGLAYMTPMEMEAMNALRREPGFLGRMARVGGQLPFDHKDGVPAFWWGSDDDDDNDNDNDNDTSSSDDGGSTWDSITDTVSGWGDSISDFFDSEPSGSENTTNTTVGSGGGFNPTDSLSGLGGTTSTPSLQYDASGNPYDEDKAQQVFKEVSEAQKLGLSYDPATGRAVVQGTNQEVNIKKNEDGSLDFGDNGQLTVTDNSGNTLSQGDINSMGGGGDTGGTGGQGMGPGFDPTGLQNQIKGLQEQLTTYQGGEEDRNKAAVTEAMKERDEGERQTRVDEYQTYKDDFGKFADPGGLADLSGYRDKMAGATGEGGYRKDIEDYRTAADQLRTAEGTGVADKFRDYESAAGTYRSAIDRMGDRGGDVKTLADELGRNRGQYQDLAEGLAATGMYAKGDLDTLRSDVGTRKTQLGDLQTKAGDLNELMKTRGLYAGQLEGQRKGTEEGRLANIRRSMAASGASPAEIARAVAEAQKGTSRAGREDALRASTMALQTGQGMIGQQAGLAGQRAALAGQQAGMAATGANLLTQGITGAGSMIGQGINALGQQGNMLGQAQGLGLQKQQAGMGALGQQAGLYGTGVGAQQGLINMGAGLTGTGAGMTGDIQSSRLRELTAKTGLMGAQIGMTDAQLADALARQDRQFQIEMADKAAGIDTAAAAARAQAGEDAADKGGGGLLESLERSDLNPANWW